MAEAEDYDFELPNMWKARDSEAIIEHIDYSFYDGNLDCTVFRYYKDGQDFFLEMANSDELSTRALAHILLTPSGLLDSARENFYLPEHATLYKLEDILPVYEKFIRRNDFIEDDLELAGKGFVAVLKGTRRQMTDVLFKRCLKILSTNCKQLPSILPIFPLERVLPLMTGDDGIMKAFYTDTCSIPVNETLTDALEKIFIGKRTMQRSLLNFLYPFLVGRGYKLNRVTIHCLYGALTEATNYFLMMRKNHRHLDILRQFRWGAAKWKLNPLIILLEICLKPCSAELFSRLNNLMRYSGK
ncbi:hypothetical protein Ciccas_012255, partial [Cichlidogyrus casuarinus]